MSRVNFGKVFLILITFSLLVGVVYYLNRVNTYPSSLSFRVADHKLSFNLQLDPTSQAFKQKFGLDEERLESALLEFGQESSAVLDFLKNLKLTFKDQEGRILIKKARDFNFDFFLGPLNDFSPQDFSLKNFPKDTFFYLREDKLTRQFNLAGSEIFSSNPNPLILGVFPVGKEAGFAFVQKLSPGQEINKDLENLKYIPSETSSEERTDAPNIGFSKNLIRDIEVKTLALPNVSLVPTYGQVGENLVVASNPESFAKIIEVSEKADGASFMYEDKKGLVFVDFEVVKEFGLDNLLASSKGYLKISQTKEAKEVFGKLLKAKKFLGVWNNNIDFEGVMTYD